MTRRPPQLGLVNLDDAHADRAYGVRVPVRRLLHLDIFEPRVELLDEQHDFGVFGNFLCDQTVLGDDLNSGLDRLISLLIELNSLLDLGMLQHNEFVAHQLHGAEKALRSRRETPVPAKVRALSARKLDPGAHGPQLRVPGSFTCLLVTVLEFLFGGASHC